MQINSLVGAVNNVSMEDLELLLHISIDKSMPSAQSNVWMRKKKTLRKSYPKKCIILDNSAFLEFVFYSLNHINRLWWAFYLVRLLKKKKRIEIVQMAKTLIFCAYFRVNKYWKNRFIIKCDLIRNVCRTKFNHLNSWLLTNIKLICYGDPFQNTSK